MNGDDGTRGDVDPIVEETEALGSDDEDFRCRGKMILKIVVLDGGKDLSRMRKDEGIIRSFEFSCS